MGRAQTIQIYLPSGDPAGLRVASLTTRTVRVFEYFQEHGFEHAVAIKGGIGAWTAAGKPVVK